MSWLIEEESIDRFVLDDIGENLISGHFEHDVEGSDRERGQSVENDVGNLPPMGTISLRNGTSVVLPVNSSNTIIDTDQQSIHSGITILPSCSSSVDSHQEQVASMQDSPHSVSMIDEDAALSLNVNSIDSSILTEFSGSHLISSVNSCEISEPLGGVATDCSVDDTTDVSVGSLSYEYNPLENESKNTHWYNRFKSEKEWDEFQEKTKQLLDAVDCPLEERNELITQLISMEEQLFWNSNDDHVNEATMMQTPKLSWLLEVVALSASIAVAGVVIARYLKHR